MKVSAVTPAADASDPTHPDHDRWVKDRTLKMEIDHAKAVGLPLRHAEAENLRLLDRAERIARDSKPAPRKTKPAAITPDMPRKGHRQRMLERGVTIKQATPEVSILKLSPCGRCGTCRNCMRERRVLLIVQKRKDDAYLAHLAGNLFMAGLHASARTGKFKGLVKRDVDRKLTAMAEEACDLSVSRLGEWRR